MRCRGRLLNEDLHDLPLLFATTGVEATPLRLSLQVGDVAHHRVGRPPTAVGSACACPALWITDTGLGEQLIYLNALNFVLSQKTNVAAINS
jgi:hypothetical protein